jgi:hypothetical protein
MALVKTDVSEESSASFINVTGICELGTTPDEGDAPKHRILQEPHGVKSQKTPFFIVTTVKTSNLTETYFNFFTECYPVKVITTYSYIPTPLNNAASST